MHAAPSGAVGKKPVGYLGEASALRGVPMKRSPDPAAALEIYERLSKTKTSAPDDVLMRLGRVAKAIGDRDKATEAFSRVVYEFPLSDYANNASAELENLPIAPIVPGSNRYKLELGRGERLFGSKRYALARASFEAVRSSSQGDDRELVNLGSRVRLL
jgi:hypothetical protein